MFLPRPTLESKQPISGDVVGRDADLMARLTPRYVQISPDAVGMERKLRTRELLRETIRFLPSPDGFRAGEIYLESFRGLIISVAIKSRCCTGIKIVVIYWKQISLKYIYIHFEMPRMIYIKMRIYLGFSILCDESRLFFHRRN